MVIFPLSMRLRSSMSLMMESRYSPDFLEVSRCFFRVSESSMERSANSLDPMMALSGVRMSCDILVKKSLFRFTRALSILTFWFLLTK